MQEQTATQYGRIKSCNQQTLKVQEELEFFGQEAVGRAVYMPPKLHEPDVGKEHEW